MPADPYGANPLAEEMKARDPLRYEAVAAVKQSPKLFAGGTADVPPFTASGIDPQLLLRLPVGIRHAAAANPDITQVHAWFENYIDQPDAEIDHDGLRAAKLRMAHWLANTDLDTRTPEQRQADDAAEYAQFFNPENDRLTHSIEQKRREEAGEEPLPEFNDLQAQRQWRQNHAAAGGQ